MLVSKIKKALCNLIQYSSRLIVMLQYFLLEKNTAFTKVTVIVDVNYTERSERLLNTLTGQLLSQLSVG